MRENSRMPTEMCNEDRGSPRKFVRERLTGLSDECRACTETHDLSGRWTRTTVSYDAENGRTTETVESSDAGTATTVKKKGVALETHSLSGDAFSEYDAFGRVAKVSRSAGGAAVAPQQSFDYAPCGDLLATYTFTNNADVVSESYVYDMLGNRIATTDAQGNVVFRDYDPFGRVVAEWGATYPVRYTYDSAGRRTSLSTTRDGDAWDTTIWDYDAATGLCMAKTYADDSTVYCTYTSDGLPLRTTYASGRWTENVYNEKREVVSVLASDGADATVTWRDEFGRVVSESNVVACVVYSLADNGTATNETACVGSEVKPITRKLDDSGRVAEIDGTSYRYASDGALATVSNAVAVVSYLYTSDRLDAGYTLTLSNGVTFTRSLERDPFRRSLVTGIATTASGASVGSLAYTYDALSRPTTRNADTFSYNERSEVISAFVTGNSSEYGYDEIGNSTNWTANCLNQYETFPHDEDGNLLSDGVFSFTYDSANRLKTVSSNCIVLTTNFYDAKSRRVKKVTSSATTAFFYDGWNLIEERIAYTNGTSSTIRYFWGKDLSRTLQGAGGVGGLLYLTIDGVPYVPTYDNNGNITRYLDANGNTVASYTYDAFGKTISASGPLAHIFRHRFSTKYYNTETGQYYYGYRFYHPSLMRWLNRDPIEEKGGENLYVFCRNNSFSSVDSFGLDRYMTTFSADPRKTQWHVGVAVDTWKCSGRKWVKTGVVTFDFGMDDSSFWNRMGTYFVTVGIIVERAGNNLVNSFTIPSTPKQDIVMLNRIRSEMCNPPLYSFFFHNCIHWANKVVDYGMDK